MMTVDKVIPYPVCINVKEDFRMKKKILALLLTLAMALSLTGLRRPGGNIRHPCR